jgi:hypothetical protein
MREGEGGITEGWEDEGDEEGGRETRRSNSFFR